MSVTLPMVFYNGTDLAAEDEIRVHWQCFKSVTLWVHVTALDGTPSDETLNIKVRHKMPREGSSWVDIASAAITEIDETDVGSLPVTQFITLDEADLVSEDMQILVTPTFTGSTEWTLDMSAVGRL